MPIEFDVRWNESFRNESSWEAAWIFVKFQVGSGPWQHATLSKQPGDLSVGNDHGEAATISPSDDGAGAFVSRATVGEGPVDWDDVRVHWNYEADGVPDDSEVSIRVMGIEMVYIPEGPFFVGDGGGGDIRGNLRGAAGALPFAVTAEAPIQLGGLSQDRLDSNDGYGMDESFPDDFSETTPVQLPARFPKGFAAFYVMKYELTEGQYASFLNTLDGRQRLARNPALKDPRARPGLGRYTITSIHPFTATVPDRAAHLLSWMDGAAFGDWASLRPITELEFEKAARGPGRPNPGEFAWGTNEINSWRYALLSINAPRERVRNVAVGIGNATYDLTAGGPDDCWSCLRGPLKVGAFKTAGATREESGASYYRVLDLSGNLVERVVSIGTSTGRRFDGQHGDGNLNEIGNASGLEVSRWPGSSATGATSQIIGALGSGFRGGSWATPTANLRISDREYAATPDNSRHPAFGYRFGRTAPSSPVR